MTMIQQTRKSKTAMLCLLVVAGMIALCSHTAHKNTWHVDGAGDEQACRTGCASTAHQHDHGHCKFDAMHNHFFRVCSNELFVKAPWIVTSVTPLVQDVLLAFTRSYSERLSNRGLQDNSITSIRLLI